MKITAATLAFAALATLAPAQDFVRLKSGRHIAGEILQADAEAEGFYVKRWDTGGMVYVRWEQVSGAEKQRITGAGAAATGQLFDAVRILTTMSRLVIGRLVSEDDRAYTVKIKGQTQNVQIIKSAVAKFDKVRLPESDLYTPDEMLDKRLAAADARDANALADLAEFARRAKLFARAVELFKQAAGVATDPKLAADLKNRGLETEAQMILAEIQTLSENADFDNALVKAESLIATHGQTETVKAKPDLVEAIKKAQEDFVKNRDETLKKLVLVQWRKERSTRLQKIVTDDKDDIQKAMADALALDEQLVQALGEKLKAQPEEIQQWWSQRDKKMESASYGPGTWIARGGQDGGEDLIEIVEDDKKTSGQGDTIDDLFRRFKQGGMGQGQPNGDYSEPLESSAEWWTKQSVTVKREWLEAYYAESSPFVTRDTDPAVTKTCSRCSGAGSLTLKRKDKKCRVFCPRCHNHTARDKKQRIGDVEVKFW